MFNFPGQVSPQSRSIVTGRLTTLRRKADVEGGPVKAVGKTCKCRRLNGILSIYLNLLTSRKVFFLPRLGHWFGQTRLCQKLVTSSYRIKLQKTRNESERIPIPTGKAVKTRRMSLSQALIGGKRGWLVIKLISFWWRHMRIASLGRVNVSTKDSIFTLLLNVIDIWRLWRQLNLPSS